MRVYFLYLFTVLFSFVYAEKNDKIELAKSSVVGVSTEVTGPMNSQLDQHITSKKSSIGSGVILSEDGKILTNAHVVSGADNITITFDDGKQFYAHILGSDEMTDVAVLQLNNSQLKTTPIRISHKTTHIGDKVIAIGNPFNLHQTVTSGIISSLHRSLANNKIEDFIQIDASINPGNSGGALVNSDGELIGINTSIITHHNAPSGIGFAMPTSLVLPISKQLINHGKIKPGTVGIKVQKITNSVARALNKDTTSGALINEIIEGSSAQAIGLKEKDIITHINNVTVENPNHLKSMLYPHQENTKVTLKILRNAKTITLDAPLKPNKNAATITTNRLLDGVLTENYSVLNEKNTMNYGVRVLYVSPHSQANLNGLRPGDILLTLNDQPLHDIKQLQKAIKNPKSVNLFKVQTGDHFHYIAIEHVAAV